MIQTHVKLKCVSNNYNDAITKIIYSDEQIQITEMQIIFFY